jgi:antitoxin ParD1/3/4
MAFSYVRVLLPTPSGEIITCTFVGATFAAQRVMVHIGTLPAREVLKGMKKNTSITIGEQLGAFVERQIEQGRYGSASDVVRAGLRLLEEREAKLEALRAALIEGEQSGPPTPFDFDAFIARKRRERKSSS